MSSVHFAMARAAGITTRHFTIGFGPITIVANSNNGTPKIGGRTLTFGVSATGSTGYVQVGSINGNVYYK